MPKSVTSRTLPNWLPAGKKAAICISIDDVHPSTSSDRYEAGGDLEQGALKHWLWLHERHPELKATFFVTADWRNTYSYPVRFWPRLFPGLGARFYWAPILKKGTMRLDRHPRFVEFIKQLDGVEIALHGLSHCHRGPRVNVEFQNETVEETRQICEEMLAIFRAAGIRYAPGMCPPGWNAPDALLQAMISLKLRFIASARDLVTPIEANAVTSGSGMHGVSLLYPQLIKQEQLLHIPANFSPGCSVDRAIEIIEHNGLLSVKVHVIKNLLGRVAIDGLDESYRNYLDLLFNTLKDRYQDKLWWTSMGEIAHFVNLQSSAIKVGNAGNI